MERDYSYSMILDKNIQIMSIMTDHVQKLNDMLDNIKNQDQLDIFDQILQLSKAIRLLSETSHITANELNRLNIEIEKLKADNN